MFPSTQKTIYVALESVRNRLLSVCHAVDYFDRPLPFVGMPVEFFATIEEAHIQGQQWAKDGWKVHYVEMPTPEEKSELLDFLENQFISDMKGSL